MAKKSPPVAPPTASGTGPLAVVAGRDTKGRKAAKKSAETSTDGVLSEAERLRLREEWGLDGLNETGKQILALQLNKPKMRDAELAGALGLTRSYVCQVRNTPAYKAAYEAMTLDALSIIQGNKTKAARKLGKLIDSMDDQVALKACIEHLRAELQRPNGSSDDSETFSTFLQQVIAKKRAATGTESASASEES